MRNPKPSANLWPSRLALLMCLLGMGLGGFIPATAFMTTAASGATAPTRATDCTDLRALRPLASLVLPSGHTHADITNAIKVVTVDVGLAQKASTELHSAAQHAPSAIAEHDAAAGATAATSAENSEKALVTQALDLLASPKTAALIVSVSTDALAVAGDIATVNTYVTVLSGYEALACS